MSNFKQRAFAWILSAGLIFSGVPSSAIAEESETQKVTEVQVSTEKQTEAATEKKAEEKPAEKETEKSAEKSSDEEKSSEKTSEKTSENTSEKSSEITSENTSEKSSEESSEKASEEQQSEKESEQTSEKETKESETEASSEAEGTEKESESETEAASFEVRFEISEGVTLTVDGKVPENNKAKTKDGVIVFKAEAKKGYKITSVQSGKKDLTAEKNGEYKVSGITKDGTVITIKAEKEEAPIPDIKVEMQIVDEDGHIIGGSRTRALPDFEKELVLNAPEKAPFEIEYYQFKEAKIEDKTIDSIVKTASEKEEDGSVRYAYAAVSGKEQTPLTKDTLITLSYEQVFNKTVYSGSDGSVSVTAVLEKKEAVPDYAVLKVTGVTGGNGYGYDAYMSALSSISDIVPHNSNNTLLYDIAFMVPEKDEVGKDTGKMIEYHPEAGSVSIHVTFNGNQISDQLGAKDPAYVQVTHLSLSDQVLGRVDSTAAATGVSPADIIVEPLGASVSLDGSTDTAAFSVTGFSVFAFSYMVDFVYDGYEFNLEGADSVLLSELFEQLGIEADAGKAIIAEFSDESLLSAQPAEADWLLTSLAPFKTEETLTVTMADGAKYVIGVTDDVTVEAKVRSVDEDGKPLGEAGIQILDEEGETVAEWTSDEKDHVIEGLEPGVEYTLHEAQAPEGYLPAQDSTFVLKENGAVDTIRSTAVVKKGVLLLANETTDIEVWVYDDQGNFAYSAAFEILDAGGNVIAELTSEEGNPVLPCDGLKIGQEYTLREVQAPDGGFVKADDISFSLEEDEIGMILINIGGQTFVVRRITVGHEKPSVTISKVDGLGEPLAGAALKILDGEGNAAAEWTSDEKDHEIKGELIVGEEYTLHEESAPDGYIAADDIAFSFNEDGKLIIEGKEQEKNTITVKNRKPFIIRKVDENGAPLAGAEFSLRKEGEAQPVTWVSSEKDEVFDELTAGKYTLSEVEAPDGYLPAADTTFDLNENGEATNLSGENASLDKDGVLVIKDQPEKATGSLTLGGTKYIFFSGLNGYEYKNLTEDDIFTYEIQELGEDASVLKTWKVKNDSTGKINYPTFNYVRDTQRDDTGTHYYTIRETSKSRDGITPDNWKYTLEVNVRDDGSRKLRVDVSGVDDITQLNFFNEYKASGSITLRADKALAGSSLEAGDFQFEVLSSNGTVITRTANAADGSVTFPAINFTQGLDGTYTYTIREVLPSGVDKDHPFTGGVYFDTSVHTVKVTAKDNGKGKMSVSAVYDDKSDKDIPKFVNYLIPVRVRKLSSSTGNYIYGAKMQLKAGSVVLDTWTTQGYDYPLYGLNPGVTYTLHEVSAPNGYQVAKDTTFTLAPDGSFMKSKTTADISSDGALIVYDSLIPAAAAKTGTGGKAIGRRGPIVNYETGDDTPIALYVGLLAAAAALVILLLVLRRRKRK